MSLRAAPAVRAHALAFEHNAWFTVSRKAASSVQLYATPSPKGTGEASQAIKAAHPASAPGILAMSMQKSSAASTHGSPYGGSVGPVREELETHHR